MIGVAKLLLLQLDSFCINKVIVMKTMQLRVGGDTTILGDIGTRVTVQKEDATCYPETWWKS